jgi:hypothetical protein
MRRIFRFLSNGALFNAFGLFIFWILLQLGLNSAWAIVLKWVLVNILYSVVVVRFVHASQRVTQLKFWLMILFQLASLGLNFFVVVYFLEPNLPSALISQLFFVLAYSPISFVVTRWISMKTT